jgi:peptidoglycan/LPS O-acetylase OafA/YrhL
MHQILSARMQPQQDDRQPNKYYDYGLEGLRGLAALWVGYAHAFNFEYLLDPAYHPHNKYISLLHASHGAVLIFFVLSGYVIGLTNKHEFTKKRAINYLIRRGIRLIPIYIIAVIIGALFSPQASLTTIIGNLFFLQPLAVPVISGNPILWTLNYEVVYYLIFLLVWYFKPKASILLPITLTIAIFGWFNPSFPQLLSAYAAGWLFWLCGLWLAWKVQPSRETSTRIPLLSYILLLAATNHFSTGKVILNGLGFANKNAEIISFSDLAFLPICLLLVATITNKSFKGINFLSLCSFAIPITTTIFLLIAGRLWDNHHWSISAIYTVLAIIFLKFKLKANILKKLSYLGSISYAFYVFHFPLMHLVGDYFPFRGSIASFVIRFFTWLFLTIAISSYIELVIQPKIKHWFQQKLLLKTT